MNCRCRLPPHDRDRGGGWLDCPQEARGILGSVLLPDRDGRFIAGLIAPAVRVREEAPPPSQVAQLKPAPVFASAYSGDICDACGGVNMRRTGTCLTCGDCGNSSGGCS